MSVKSYDFKELSAHPLPESVIIKLPCLKRARPGCDWLVTNVWQNDICRLSAYGRVAVTYVQSLGLKVVAAVLLRSNQHPATMPETAWWLFVLGDLP